MIFSNIFSQNKKNKLFFTVKNDNTIELFELFQKKFKTVVSLKCCIDKTVIKERKNEWMDLKMDGNQKHNNHHQRPKENPSCKTLIHKMGKHKKTWFS